MKARIDIELDAPTECTEEEFKEWLMFEFGQCPEISLQNPLHHYQFDPYVADSIRISITE